MSFLLSSLIQNERLASTLYNNLQKEAFSNIVEKVENDGRKAFSPFSTIFSNISDKKNQFLIHLYSSKALNLDKYIVLLFGKGLNTTAKKIVCTVSDKNKNSQKVFPRPRKDHVIYCKELVVT